MKKLALVLGLMALILVGASAADKTVLKFYYYIDATQAGYAEDQALWKKFQAANPDIDLQIEINSSQPYHQKLQAYISAGELPDVVYIWPTSRDSSKQIQDQKLVKDLRTVLPQDLLSKFSPLALDVNNQSSHILAELPQAFTYTTTVYANTGLLKSLGLKVPTTYAELKALVPKLKVKGIQTLALPDADKWPAQSCLFSTISGRLVGDKFIDDVKAGKAKFTDEGFVNALKFYESLYKDGVIDKSNVNLGYGEGPGIFASGKAAFFVDGDWRVGAFLTDKSTGKALIDPAAQKTNFDLVNFPAIPGEINKGTVSAIAGVGLAINKDLTGAKLDAAKRLLEFYYSKEFLTVKWETGAFVPSRLDVTSDKLEPLAVKLPLYYKSIPKTTYVLDGVLDPTVFNILNDGLQAIGLGVKTPAQVAADMQKAQDALK